MIHYFTSQKNVVIGHTSIILDIDKQTDRSTDHLPLPLSTDISRHSFCFFVPCWDPEVNLLTAGLSLMNVYLLLEASVYRQRGKTSCPWIPFLYYILTQRSKYNQLKLLLVICMVSYNTMKWFLFLVCETHYKCVNQFPKGYKWTKLHLFLICRASQSQCNRNDSVIHKLNISKSLLTFDGVESWEIWER